MKQVGPTEELPQGADVVLDMTGQIALTVFKRRLPDEHAHAKAVDGCKARRT